MTYNKLICSILLLLLAAFIEPATARNFLLFPHNSLLGGIKTVRAHTGDTPATLAQRYNIGVNAILAANPGTFENSVFTSGSPVKINSAFLLPPLAHEGIIINLPEMRLYYYLPNGQELMTFPIGIGRIGKTIPILRTYIIRKVKNPVWIPPEDIRRYNEEQGITLPKIMPAGPDNPLGPYAIYLKLPTYLIHSTIFPESIGRRASFGCIRMNENDIEQFFPIATQGTLVEIIDMPNKIAWSNSTLYLEAHPPLEERSHLYDASLNGIVNLVEKQLSPNTVTLVNWQLLPSLIAQPDGIPHMIGIRLR